MKLFHDIDGLNIPFPDKSIDFLIGYSFSYYLDDKRKFLRDFYRILNFEGGVYFW